jgi:hypothetical protein
MSLRWWGLLLLLAWLSVNALHEQWRQRRQLRVLQNRCSEPGCAASICVLIRAYRDGEAATTVRRLLEQAYCPFRVYVGIVEEVGSDTVGALVPPHPTLVDHVHSCQTDFKMRWEVEAWRLYRGEAHVLFVHSDTLLGEHWDRQLLALGDGVWSALPAVRHYKYPHLHRTRAGHTGGHCGQPDFYRLARLPGAWRAPTWTAARAALAQPTATLLWTSRFGFGPAAVLEQAVAQLRGLASTAEGLDDCLLAGALLAVVPQLRSPGRQLAWTLGEHLPLPMQRCAAGPTHEALAAAYAAYSGVDVSAGKVATTARLGLARQPTEAEILRKYGSLARYQAEQRKNVGREETAHGPRPRRAARPDGPRVSHLRVPRHSEAPVSVPPVV